MKNWEKDCFIGYKTSRHKKKRAAISMDKHDTNSAYARIVTIDSMDAK